MPKGGRREGSGRKPAIVPKKTFSAKLTEEEEAKVREFIKALRGKPSE